MKVHILHTNDLHGHLEHIDLLAKYIQQRRDEIEQAGDKMILCDVGDAIDFWHPLVEATQGQIIVDLFNQVQYDVVTLGNNEGLNISRPHFDRLVQAAQYSFVCGNLRASHEKSDLDSVHQVVIKELDGVRIAFLGLTAPYPSYSLNGYQVLDPYDVLEDQLQALHARSSEWDYLVLLSHLGYQADREIAQRFEGIDLILGGHTHHYLRHGERISGVTLAACGRYGEYMGEVVLDDSSKDLVISTKSLDEIREGIDPGSFKDYLNQGESQLDTEAVAWLPEPWDSQLTAGQNSLIEQTFNAICDQMDCCLAMLSTGMFLTGLPQGRVNMRHLHQALPHPVHVVKLHIQGLHLRKALWEIQSQREQLVDRHVSGCGFRGKYFGEMVFRGIAYDSAHNDWLIEGLPLNDQQTYQFVTLDHYLLLPFFPSLRDHIEIQILFPDFLRQIMRRYLQKHYPLI